MSKVIGIKSYAGQKEILSQIESRQNGKADHPIICDIGQSVDFYLKK